MVPSLCVCVCSIVVVHTQWIGSSFVVVVTATTASHEVGKGVCVISFGGPARCFFCFLSGRGDQKKKKKKKRDANNTPGPFSSIGPRV